MDGRRIGEILVAEGVLTEAAVNRALRLQHDFGAHIRLGTLLLNRDPLAEEALLQALARHYRVEAASWSALSGAPIEVTRLIPSAMAIRFGAFPYAATNTSIHIAFVDPSNLAARDELSALTNRLVIATVALEIRLFHAHQKFYGRQIPAEYRSIVERIEQHAARTKQPGWQ